MSIRRVLVLYTSGVASLRQGQALVSNIKCFDQMAIIVAQTERKFAANPPCKSFRITVMPAIELLLPYFVMSIVLSV
ncbi:MAG: hypothetical protein RSB09_03455 [Clostridia bacterium]